ncbi:ParB/RepB/Spo0J family partition protein [Streptomyces sp. NPDC058960]|uniref:ParB/RepB/Spo0J family partition protein n=1 Tax=Streptomyces sp. NPDC058960 TaxID=3346679 RepID=UPI00367BB8C4
MSSTDSTDTGAPIRETGTAAQGSALTIGSPGGGLPLSLADSAALFLDTADPEAAHHNRLSPVELVPIDSLLPAASPRLGGEDAAHARTLAGSGATLPPVIVHRATMRVVDGMHRLRAARLRGEERLPVRFFDGSEHDAFVLAVELNVKHGLPLSTADRTAAAHRILRTHPQWSDRAIASVVGLSARTVCAIRQRMEGPEPQAAVRVGRDGRVRPLSTAEARRQAGAFIAAHPEASLRVVAAAVGISPGTVRDVRQRVLRGEDPVPPGQRERRAAKPAGVDRPVDGTEGADEDTGRAGRPARTRGGRGAAGRPAAEERDELLRVLSRDPSVRLTENGRYLLRLMATHAVPAERRRQLVDSVPPHCTGIAAGLARQCAEAWLDLARSLDGRAG